MLAVAYARWSSLEQGKGSTLERQLQVVERYCSQRGLEIFERVVDEGTSAYSGDNIEIGNLGKLIRRIEAGTVATEQRQASYLSCALRARGGACDHRPLVPQPIGRATAGRVQLSR